MAEQSKDSRGACNVHLISGSHSVTVNNGAGGVAVDQSRSSILPPTTIRRVIVTPLTSKKPCTPSHNTARHTKSISKVLTKVFTKGTKKDPKMFTLRNIKPDEVSTVYELECVIRDQLCDEISEDEEVQEVKKKRKRIRCDDEIGETRKKNIKGEDRDKKVQATISLLTEKHGDKSYTPMQYRVWTEMYLGGVHPTLDTPPTTSMFNRAGGGSARRSTGHTGEVVSAINDLTSALSPRVVSPSSGSTTRNSPARMIDNRTKCYKQLADLKSLFENNVLSEEEYDTERSVILGVLKKLV